MLADQNSACGQNSSTIPHGDLADADNQLHDTGRRRLLAFIERIESVNKAKAILGDDLKAIYDEAKNSGFDVKALRVVIKSRAQDQDKLQAHEGLVATYLHAISDQFLLPM